MKIEYDKEADAAYIYLVFPIKDNEVKKTIKLNQNIFLDFDKDEKLLGLEVLEASKVLNKKVISEAQEA